MEQDEHVAVQSLLPWYASGKLGDDEVRQVQEHLLHCQACRNELAAEQPMQTLLTVAGALPECGDVELSLAKMHALMQPTKSMAPPAPVAPRWMAWVLGLQGAAIAMLLGLWLQARPPEPAYEGLSASGSAPVLADALIMFKPDTSERAVRELLLSEGAGVVAGPTETGAWLLRVDARGLAALRKAPIVALAESLQARPPR
ncbi:zf-HC2 domain-containing protein [Paucibacter sp. DJ1R-11]|uniref:zf-HC2 domain-containing protein n=1 Tax=Paucibacter sp. DJ1R-11 TaxID=2893556 RepID=UPI0021E46365|nr:zf-HC2 domain-containing protein [Paucibacter sp. DJ1R-11]